MNKVQQLGIIFQKSTTVLALKVSTKSKRWRGVNSTENWVKPRSMTSKQFKTCNFSNLASSKTAIQANHAYKDPPKALKSLFNVLLKASLGQEPMINLIITWWNSGCKDHRKKRLELWDPKVLSKLDVIWSKMLTWILKIQIHPKLLYKNTKRCKNRKDTGTNFNPKTHPARERTTLMLTRQLELTEALI